MYDYRSTGRFPEKEGTAVHLRVGVGEGLRETFDQRKTGNTREGENLGSIQGLAKFEKSIHL